MSINNDNDCGFGYAQRATTQRTNIDEQTRWSYNKPTEQAQTLPSRFQVGDDVNIILKEGTYFNAMVIKVAFTMSKVLYDVEYVFNTVEQDEVSQGPDLQDVQVEVVSIVRQKKLRMYNVDSAYVVPVGQEKI